MKFVREGQNIKIRKLFLSDAMDIYKNINDKEIVKWTLAIPFPYKLSDARKFIRRSQNKVKKKTGYVFGIALKETNNVVGIVSILSVDKQNKKAELGYWIGRKYWGKGLTAEAVRLVLKFCFYDLRLHKVYARTFEKNIGSKTMLEKNGFKLEGTLRESFFRRNRWHDELCYGLLRSEFL